MITNPIAVKYLSTVYLHPVDMGEITLADGPEVALVALAVVNSPCIGFVGTARRPLRCSW